MIHTLKGRLILTFTLILALAAVLTFLLYSDYSRALVERNLVSATSSSIRFIMDNVDRKLDECRNLSDWIFVNRYIDKMLVRNYGSPINNLDRDVSAAMKTISDRITSSTISDDVLGIIIQGDNGVILSSGEEAYYTSLDTLSSQDWVLASKNRMTFSWVGLKPNLSRQHASGFCLPIARAVIYSDTRKQIGWQYISFSASVIGSVLLDLRQPKGYDLFLVDKTGNVIYSNRAGLLGTVLSNEQALKKLGEDPGDTYFPVTFEGSKALAFTARSSYGSFYAMQFVDDSLLESEKAVASRDALWNILIIIGLGSVLAAMITSTLTRPIGLLMKRMQAIASGDFEQVKEIEGDHELGRLGKGMNQMAAELQELILKAKEDEKKKSVLEFKVLQNQINPHFVYNVLNSVKMMALIQKSTGIYNMVTSLGVLLKEVSKGASDLIPLKEELYLLDKYLDIQIVRRNGLLKSVFDVSEDSLSSLIPKFTLQPIVENAIVHGLSDKRGMGIIEIRGWLEKDMLWITIRDNGVGIPPEKLPTLLEEREESRGLYYNGVGLSNVAQRLRMVFSGDCSLDFSSELGGYTLVSLRIPVTRKVDEA